MSVSGVDDTWLSLHAEVVELAKDEPTLASYLHATVINHDTLEDSLSYLLASKLASPDLPAMSLRDVIGQVFVYSVDVRAAIRADLAAAVERDPAAHGVANPFLNHKGFHALQGYRVSHWFWQKGRRALALYLQSRLSEIFSVDIHPAAAIGSGIFIDHATGVVVGETAVVEDGVSMLQEVTLGGTGKESGDRHPKIGRGVLLSAGAKILGNIRIGAYSKVGAGSVVLEDMPAHSTIVGVPARVVGRCSSEEPASCMDQKLEASGDT
ncbi:serine O-acetyltransferase [Alkalilimnicola ehrlichii]|uniref:Serine acetyltransferase n=1 Tax=Alkalilimnicola ehrlichii TaxID=351052 RepID=A0A3E0WJ00_9GAMM|nr:serine O-acetyltransferase [Alkalilimnicola ehrlichii]RFA25314.1 serine O-acetyltransferase [Alkalilimnicola ehrlichii]RFA32429.1 serine O-acetyltransferase [Alkalilimnicola ehrlichii]